MKRKKQIFGCILIIGLLCFMHIRAQDLYFSPEGVFTAYEEGHHRKPYKGIVLAYETEYGKMLFPVLTGALAAQGGVTTSAAKLSAEERSMPASVLISSTSRGVTVASGRV